MVDSSAAMAARYREGEARWTALHALDPEGRQGSRRAAAEREALRKRRFPGDGA